MWEGATVYVIGGGPSVKDQDLTALHDTGHRVIGVNNAFELGPWVDVCYFGDCRWLDWNHKGLQQYSGLVVTSCQRPNLRERKWMKVLKRDESKNGISKRPGSICWNLNSGASAIDLAVKLGAKKVVLLGFDMKTKAGGGNKGHNWHDRHTPRHTPADTIYAQRFLPGFKKIKADLDALEIECANATPDSALTLFEMVRLEDVV